MKQILIFLLCPNDGIGRRSGLTWAQWLVEGQHFFLRPKSAVRKDVPVQVRLRAPVRPVVLNVLKLIDQTP